MRKALAVLWALLGIGWAAAIVFIANRIGGFRYLGHTGMGIPALADAAMAFLCIVVALLAGGRGHVPVAFRMAVLLGALIHIVNLVTFGLSLEKRAPFALLLFMHLVPTNSIFTSAMPNPARIFLLPGISLLLAIIPLGKANVAAKQDG